MIVFFIHALGLFDLCIFVTGRILITKKNRLGWLFSWLTNFIALAYSILCHIYKLADYFIWFTLIFCVFQEAIAFFLWKKPNHDIIQTSFKNYGLLQTE